MKIIAGYARGVELLSPEADAKVRPTIGRSREALFSSLGDLAGARVLDLFSGSGALGLEAASRGAARVVMVEIERSHLRIIEENIRRVKRTGAPGELLAVAADATIPANYLGGGGFDLVLADPPYAVSFEAFGKLAGTAGKFFPGFAGARIVWELPDEPGAAGKFIELAAEAGANWDLRKFGGTEFLWLRL